LLQSEFHEISFGLKELGEVLKNPPGQPGGDEQTIFAKISGGLATAGSSEQTRQAWAEQNAWVNLTVLQFFWVSR